jgi:fluoroquinolone transport system permease protein
MGRYLRVVNADRKRIFRDPFLLFMVVMPVVFALVLRHLLPVLRDRFIDVFDLASYYPLAIGLFIVTPALYIAAVLSLQLIEEQEENILSAVAATPFSLNRYFGVRLAGYTVLAAILMTAVQLLIGMSPLSFAKVGLLAITLSLQVPILALGIAVCASNQVEGMVALKTSSLLVLPALGMFFVQSPWHVLGGILPAYWPVMAFFDSFRPEAPLIPFGLSIAIGVAYQLALAAWLFGRFSRKAKFAC